MPKVQWTKQVGVRVIGAYRWDEENEFQCYVEPGDALEVLTNPDFRLAPGLACGLALPSARSVWTLPHPSVNSAADSRGWSFISV